MADTPVHPNALGKIDVETSPSDSPMVARAKASIRTSRGLIRMSKELKAQTESILKKLTKERQVND